MVEPTENETKETLDEFAEVMFKIIDEAQTAPDILHEAPTSTPVRRLDELEANKNPILKWCKN